MQNFTFKTPPKIANKALIKSRAEYDQMYKHSFDNPEEFWAEQAKEFLHWKEDFHTVREYDYEKAEIAWFLGGKTNVCYNSVDRHLKSRSDQTAIIWEGNELAEDREITYKELHSEVCKAANMLKANGVKKGDVVTLYMPMIPELAFCLLACSRIGAVHSVIFGGFSSEAIRTRMDDSKSEIIITADYFNRGARKFPLKSIVDEGIETLDFVERVIVYKRTGENVDWNEGRDVWFHDEMDKVSSDCPIEWMDSEDPLFILYTSGSTGKPKGVLHTTGGYNLYVAITHKYVFDYQDGDIYWCTADIGWVTGHSYIVYGPLTNGATTVMFEGTPTYPNPARFWDVVDKWKVNSFYTAPTAIRSLASHGTDYIKNHDLSSLKVLGTVGEPINPEAWMWYWENIGKKQVPIVDSWWQTETGGILISPLIGAIPQKPGSATLPFFGIKPIILDPQTGVELEGECQGVLAFDSPWPGQMRAIHGDPNRFHATYFSQYKGYYFTGDGCRRDEDGYYWITGRVDDVINVSGHRMGTAEVESALVLHHDIAEAAVVGMPHEIKGQGIYAFVTLNDDTEESEQLRKELILLVRKEIGAFAAPDKVQFTHGLPKTRSGKIMRRILRKIIEGETDKIGDTSTLADPAVVDDLIRGALV
jgi:acetyl-CoA synthetase